MNLWKNQKPYLQTNLQLQGQKGQGYMKTIHYVFLQDILKDNQYQDGNHISINSSTSIKY